MMTEKNGFILFLGLKLEFSRKWIFRKNTAEYLVDCYTVYILNMLASRQNVFMYCMPFWFLWKFYGEITHFYTALEICTSILLLLCDITSFYYCRFIIFFEIVYNKCLWWDIIPSYKLFQYHCTCSTFF